MAHPDNVVAWLANRSTSLGRSRASRSSKPNCWIVFDFYGNNGWGRNGQTEALMPILRGDLEQAGLSLVQVKEAMASIGYGSHALHQFDRWESKRTTGKFGR